MTDKILQDLSFYDYSEIEIQYSIKTSTHNLTQLTDIIKINPTRGFSINESYEGRHLNTDTKQIEASSRQRPFTLWVFNTRSLTSANRFEDHANQLLNLLAPQLENIQKLIADKDSFEIIASICLTLNREEKNFGFGSKSTLLRQLTDLTHYIEWRTK